MEDELELLEQPTNVSIYSEGSHEALYSKNSFEFVDVSFSCRESGVEVLKQISCRFERNRCYGILGSTVGGKSTLLDLAMGLLTPTSGVILVDNIPL